MPESEPPSPAKPALTPAKASPNAENEALAEAIATLVVAKMKEADDAEDAAPESGDAKPPVPPAKGENALSLRNRLALARLKM